MDSGNLYSDAAAPARGERFDTLLRQKNLVIERIVSSADILAQEYRQTQDEWVVLLHGQAQLCVEGRQVLLREGDYLFLPTGIAHTVESASAGALWLAVHLHGKNVEKGDQPDSA